MATNAILNSGLTPRMGGGGSEFGPQGRISGGGTEGSDFLWLDLGDWTQGRISGGWNSGSNLL